MQLVCTFTEQVLFSNMNSNLTELLWIVKFSFICAIKKVALSFSPNLKSVNDKYSICQVICGTDPYPKNFRAKKYKIKEKFFTKADFQLMMRNLPVPVNEDDIDAMFDFADKDRDGKINYRCT